MRIIAPVDGSTHSEYALQALAHLAPPEELVLLHAIHLPDFNYALITPALRKDILSDLEAKARDAGEHILTKAHEQLSSNFSQIQQVHQVGHPVNVILDTARSMKCDFIVLGARGLGPVKELVIGSTSHRVLTHAPCSVMIIKAPVPHVQKILLAVEGQDDTTVALQFLARQPFRNPVDIDVFTVWPQPQLAWPTTLGQTKLLEMEALSEAQDHLTSVTDRLTRMNYTCEAKVGMGDPAFAILEQAKASEADLIIMGTHGRGGLSRFLIGSVSHAVLHQVDCPVLIIR